MSFTFSIFSLHQCTIAPDLKKNSGTGANILETVGVMMQNEKRRENS